MSRKKEHSKGGRQYTKRKKSEDEKEEPVKKRCLEEKGATASTKATEAKKEPAEETEPDRELTEISSGEELPDVLWTKS